MEPPTWATGAQEYAYDPYRPPEPAALAASDLPQPCTVLRVYDEEAHAHTIYYVLGTAHVSTESCEDAARLIRLVRPDVVMLELCIERKPILSLEKLKEPSLSEVLAEVRSGRASTFQSIYGWLLARVGRNLDVLPGEEFRVALRESIAIGAQVVLGDRPLTITLARLWAALSLWEKIKLSTQLLWTGISLLDSEEMKAEIEKMKETDVLTEAILELGKEFPTLLGPLITERDQFMAYNLRRLAPRAQRVVAIVGAGHLPGIRDNWDVNIDINAIVALPNKAANSRHRWWRITVLTATGVLASSMLLRFAMRR